ncbi:uncharacterized protein LOC111715781 [Eurytemora carolleeae]|uniref:uncharacterized protein LOC111715781 n=1 Tax=Eurytemora carolleeae TaxID=1294199 RepID=UPI000C758C1D|nr:uncharacterized protein LOC111715781 [Eurytemora carolleeae]|eukprot:XP_023346917.1 uncharacterized protein LOC111715781 [Eurytemora affinis]
MDENDEEKKMKKKSTSYFMKSLEEGKGVRGVASGFSTVGKPKMAQKQYNSPLQMYSDEAIDEIMREGTLNGKPFDMNNLMNPSGAEFSQSDSLVLSLINEQEGGRKV